MKQQKNLCILLKTIEDRVALICTICYNNSCINICYIIFFFQNRVFLQTEFENYIDIIYTMKNICNYLSLVATILLRDYLLYMQTASDLPMLQKSKYCLVMDKNNRSHYILNLFSQHRLLHDFIQMTANKTIHIIMSSENKRI